MATAITLPEGAPEEVITHSLVRDVDLTPFGFAGNLALMTIDNGLDHTRPNTLGAQTLMELDAAITDALSRKPADRCQIDYNEFVHVLSGQEYKSRISVAPCTALNLACAACALLRVA